MPLQCAKIAVGAAHAKVIHIMTATTIFIKIHPIVNENSSNSEFIKNQFLMISDDLWEMFDDYLMSL